MKLDILKQFKKNRTKEIELQGNDLVFQEITNKWFKKSLEFNYSYHFDWLSRPIIQYPQDLVVMQEIIWKVKPDLIIDFGIAHGGSLIFNASMLALLDYCDMLKDEKKIKFSPTSRMVLGVDIDIKDHNKDLINSHPLAKKIVMIEGSSISEDTIQKVKSFSKGFKKILLCLDSNHSHEHVLKELEQYSNLVSKDSYCIVFDTIIDDLPKDINRNWGPNNSPKSAVKEFIKMNPNFEIDKSIDRKLMISVAPDGYLKRKV